MNKISCEIVQDLLPLYHDGMCCEKSCEMICEHIRVCAGCREELELMGQSFHVAVDVEEVDAAAAASKALKQHRKKAFRMGIVVAVLLVCISILSSVGKHYIESSHRGDTGGLIRQLESSWDIENFHLKKMAQEGDYLVLSGYDNAGKWYMSVFTRDSIFPDRFKESGGLGKIKSGKLANWNYETPEGDTILICYGVELADNLCGYTFTNSGITYTCPVRDNAVLDFFFISDTYDNRTYLEPIYE